MGFLSDPTSSRRLKLPPHWEMAELQPPTSLGSAGGLIHSSGAWPHADLSTHRDISRHSPTCFVKCGKELKKKFQGAWPNLEGRGRPSTWPGPLFWLFRQPRFARQAAVFTQPCDFLYRMQTHKTRHVRILWDFQGAWSNFEGRGRPLTLPGPLTFLAAAS